MRPDTAATRELESAGIEHRLIAYERARSAEEAAERRGVALRALVKTLVVRLEEDSYALVLVPGDASLDYKKLRGHLGVRRLTMPDPDEARDATGYERGTITPFGSGVERVIVDRRLADLEEISLGAGAHGWAIHLRPGVLTDRGAELADISKVATA